MLLIFICKMLENSPVYVSKFKILPGLYPGHSFIMERGSENTTTYVLGAIHPRLWQALSRLIRIAGISNSIIEIFNSSADICNSFRDICSSIVYISNLNTDISNSFQDICYYGLRGILKWILDICKWITDICNTATISEICNWIKDIFKWITNSLQFNYRYLYIITDISK